MNASEKSGAYGPRSNVVSVEGLFWRLLIGFRPFFKDGLSYSIINFCSELPSLNSRLKKYKLLEKPDTSIVVFSM
jgi:hypothetical protein